MAAQLAYGDYIVFGALQGARGIRPFPIVPPGDRSIDGARMTALYDGFADSMPHYE